MKISVEPIAALKAYDEKERRRRLLFALFVSVVFHLAAGLLAWRFSVGVLGSTVVVEMQTVLDIRLLTEKSSANVESSNKFVNLSEADPDKLPVAVVDESKVSQKPKMTENNATTSDSSASAVSTVKRQTIVETTPTLFPKYYYSAHELDSRPKPLFPVAPVYPPNALDIAGRVTLLLFVDEKGVVDDFRVLLSEPRGIFDEVSIQAFSKARYVAGRMGGFPVKSQFLVSITFEPGGDPTVDVELTTVR